MQHATNFFVWNIRDPNFHITVPRNSAQLPLPYPACRDTYRPTKQHLINVCKMCHTQICVRRSVLCSTLTSVVPADNWSKLQQRPLLGHDSQPTRHPECWPGSTQASMCMRSPAGVWCPRLSLHSGRSHSGGTLASHPWTSHGNNRYMMQGQHDVPAENIKQFMYQANDLTLI